MSIKVFVSYCHEQCNWVRDRLVPCLKAAGVTVLIDRERFRAGHSLVGEMDRTQDQANRNVLVLSEDYLKSKNCRHEMKRALDRDPDFKKGLTIPVRKEDCKLPPRIRIPNPLWLDMRKDGPAAADTWERLLTACGGDLGCSAPDWLKVRDRIQKDLADNYSVNLVVESNTAQWKPMIDHLKDDLPALGLRVVDLESGETISRPHLIAEILSGDGPRPNVPDPPNDVPELTRALKGRPITRLVLLHFDMVPHRQRNGYDVDFFANLAYLVKEGYLVLLVESRRPVAELLPKDHLLSKLIKYTEYLPPRA